MKKYVLRLCIGIGIGIGLFGCTPDEESPKVIADISDDFYISLWENLESPTRTFALQVETIDEQECTNTLIDYSYRRSSSTLTLSFDDILEPHPSECVDGPTTITTKVELGFLPEGSYDMQINLKNAVVNKGLLTVRNDRYILDMYSDDGFHLKQEQMWRIPEGSFWGYVAYRNLDKEDLVDTFLADVQAESQTLSLKEGYYGHFTVQGDQSIILAERPTNKYIKTFSHAFGENLEAIQTLLENYRSNYGQDLDFKIFTGLGEEW